MPSLMAAQPHALLMVLRTIMFGHSSRSSLNGLSLEKSLYASSITTMPPKLLSTFSICFLSRLLPVGLFGEHIQIIFVCLSHAARSLSAFRLYPSPSSTGRYSTLFMSAHTLYMP